MLRNFERMLKINEELTVGNVEAAVKGLLVEMNLNETFGQYENGKLLRF